MTSHSVFLVDDHPVFRFGMASLIGAEPDLQVVGEAATGEEALQKLASMEPDLVLVDLSLPDLSGLELVKRLRAGTDAPLVLVLSMHDEGLYAERAVRAGACGYLMKESGGPAIVAGVKQALGGDLVLSAKQSAAILRRTLTGKGDEEHPYGGLSDRELEVFELIGRGLGTREIAAKLGLGVKTVETHKANIKGKLELRHATELTRAAVGWVESGGSRSG